MHSTLRAARQQKGWTQVELSARAGLTQRHISQIERGQITRPTWETVSKFCKALGVRPEVIFPVTSEVA